MNSINLTITNSKGIALAAVLDVPSGSEPRAYALFAHCFTCSKDLKSIYNVDLGLSKHDIAVLRFDMTGIGESGGDFAKTNFTSQIEDFDDAARFMSENYEAPVLAIGHSLGGAVAVISSIRNHSFKAVATIAAPSEPSNLSLKLKKTREQCLTEGLSVKDIGGVKRKFTPQFFADIEKYHMLRDIKHLSKPILIMHSPVDSYGSYRNAEEIYEAANQPKSLVSLDNIDHLMLKKSDAVWVGEIIASWFEKYI